MEYNQRLRFAKFEYLPKEKVRFKLPKGKVNIETMWLIISETRKLLSKETMLLDNNDKLMTYVVTNETVSNIANIDKSVAKDLIELFSDEFQNKILIDSLIDEAFNSSVIEGAFSTRKRAGEMIQNKEIPKDKSEKMILNNYRGIRFTLDNLECEITHDFIYKLWRIISKDTISEDDISDGYRNDEVFVNNGIGEVVHEGSDHNQLFDKMSSLIEYINNSDEEPIIKACIIHYYFVYTHPFFDGNGRTARALMNFYLIKEGYEIFKYISISKILPERRDKYYKSIKISEDYDNDMTYFIDFYTKLLFDTNNFIIKQYIAETTKQIIFIYLEKFGIVLSERINKFLKGYVNFDKNIIDIKEYTRRYKVVQETARKDLEYLVSVGLFKKRKVGKKFNYSLNDIEELITRMNDTN